MSEIVMFQDHMLDVIDLNGQRWLRGGQIGTALGLRDPARAIHKIHKRNRDEFGPDMTTMLELPTNGGPQLVRIFSARGAALLAMLAKTERAVAFRAWVLDVLEGKAAPAVARALTGDQVSIPVGRYIELLEAENAHLRVTAKRRRRLCAKEKREILNLRGQGFGPAAIGRRIGRPGETVTSYLRRIRQGDGGVAHA